jgi:ABC-type multidrug transport system ATPase subunit
MPVLAIRSLRKSFLFGPAQSARRTEALAGVDLEVVEGEVVGIVGGKGAGKTTLLLCAAGLLRRDAGSIKWYGEQFSGGGCLPGLSFLPSVPTYYPFLTVREVFDYYCTREHATRARRPRLIPTIAARLGLSNYLTVTVGNLDVAMLKRVAIAQAFLDQARVILFDGSLDCLGSGAVLVHRLLRESSATIIATSRQADALAPIATRIVVMDSGRLTGSFSAIRQDSMFESVPPLIRQIAERLH